MAKEFHLDLKKFKRAIRTSPRAVKRGATQALGDIKDDWIREARDVAPMDKRNLRDQITGESDTAEVVVTANATTDSGGRFNYAYYIHELDAGGKSLRHAGTEKKFLDVSADKRETAWQQWLESDIKAALKRSGW
ncbi:hypothetical protein [Bacillus chungangensis]|uniref:HK97 gp10 family phage protein n=1 Tax=Bacillus chungangensis TaxID=587633 RepID=A0ABT9WMH5_9BACI|nr:hypothetical protein [Bacillus chungangensis]MDQ0174380.1 hypothetical protein [Bacillus chungangensis]